MQWRSGPEDDPPLLLLPSASAGDPSLKLTVRRYSLRMREPLQTAFGTVSEREVLTVSLTGEDGVTGYGEAAPLEPYDGVSIERVEQALERYRPVVEAANTMNGAEIVDACRRVEDLPEAFAAIDLALWDRAGRRTSRPVASLITDTPAPTVSVNATLSATDRAGAAEQARQAVEEGFGCLKVKVGIGDDAGRLAAIRALAGPEVALRVDANGAWDVEQAVSADRGALPLRLGACGGAGAWPGGRAASARARRDEGRDR